MKIVARVNGENQELVKKLTNSGITAKLVRGGVIVELPIRRSESCDRPVYEIPEEVFSAQLLIDVAEEGGGMTNTGSGTIVCGLEGQPLRPYYIPRSGHLACGTHAYFSILDAVVTVTGYRRDDNVTIEKHRIVRDGYTAQIESERLWNGEVEATEYRCSRCERVFVGILPGNTTIPTRFRMLRLLSAGNQDRTAGNIRAFPGRRYGCARKGQLLSLQTRPFRCRPFINLSSRNPVSPLRDYSSSTNNSLRGLFLENFSTMSYYYLH